jgi:hypothetical protein
MPFSCFQFCNTRLDVNLMSSDKASGGIVSIEDGVADSFLGVENEYSDGPRSR